MTQKHVPSWPEPSPPGTWTTRRRRLAELFAGPALFPSGFSRPRNFPGNPYPFRAESHFLYLVGRQLEGAALLHTGREAILFVAEPHEDDGLWTGPVITLEELSQRLELEVRPLDELELAPETAVLPPQDAETAAWLSSFLGREVEAGGGDALTGKDAELAEAVIQLRIQHDVAAVSQMRQAAAVTALAHRAAMATTRPGVREAVIGAEMTRVIHAHGMTHAYNPIVTVHGEILHNPLQLGVAGPSDLLLADVGAETPEGWASDVTRTWPVSGRFSTTQAELYEAVLAAQRAAIAAIAPGVRFLDVHRAAGRSLAESLVALRILKGDPAELHARGAVALFFPHGVGHLLGLDVHDLEDLGDRAGYGAGRTRSEAAGDRFLRLDRELVEHMVVTVEPGFYQVPLLLDADLGPLEETLDREILRRYSDVRGIRIEDDVLVTAAGAEVLTELIPKRLRDVECAVTSGSD